MLAIWAVLFPGLFLGTMVLAINVLGDGVRDLLDPRIARRL
jgi:peptide/nickel transport system permease protein